MKRVDLAALNAWVDSLITKQRVIGVRARGDHFAFGPLTKSEDLRLDYDVTTLPPKIFFQPQREMLLSFKAGVGYETMLETEPFVLFGIHPYDMAAIEQMDEIFSQDNYDIHYMTRRANATIVVVDVQNVSLNAFAGYMGTAYIEEGYDVHLTPIGDLYLVEAKTEKGEILMTGLDDAPQAEESWFEQRNMVGEYNKQRLKKHELRVDPSKWPELLENAYSHPVWEEKAKLCFSCGSCTLVCPTCYCFDVHEDVNWDLSSGERARVWDSCMRTNFATVAGNLNFRKNAADRYRHRYYRKGKYVPAKISGKIACVGCGRCITACVPKIANPVEIFNRLAEDK
ncbi:4Fe-4S dicluster domain-containing protein [Chloroflexota bacterium]